jgi:Lanthionine synthetase C-like protein
MLDHSSHLPLRQPAWNADQARLAINDIVTDALTHFDQERFWPAHPLEDGLPDGDTSFYLGATGVIWALEYLHRAGATQVHIDFRPVLQHLIDVNRAQFARRNYAEHGSFLFGDMGTALLAMRLAPTPGIADVIDARARANMSLPVRELMWGMPGSMLACVHMAGMTAEGRWQGLFQLQAKRLLDELEETEYGPLWTQDLYGRHLKWLGPVHGFAGNLIPLIHGWKWLSVEQRNRISEAVPRTLAKNAWRSDVGTSWRATAAGDPPPRLCQHCHGAPGIVTTFSDAPFSLPDFESLLVEGGNFTWAAGPLAKGSNLCHGTGGNGYAFLKLHRRTKDPIWIERARAFAMTAISQCSEARKELGRGRFSLWTGDVGLAVFLWDCLTGEPSFPTIDVS